MRENSGISTQVISESNAVDVCRADAAADPVETLADRVEPVVEPAGE
ncbi:MAG: hypothetical protein ABWZ98_06835 [Nakamurella sp.]